MTGWTFPQIARCTAYVQLTLYYAWESGNQKEASFDSLAEYQAWRHSRLARA